MDGKVKFFNESKGFGFIAGEDGKEYFVHKSGLTEGISIGENDEVTFEVVSGDRGPKADKVTKKQTLAHEEEPKEDEVAEKQIIADDKEPKEDEVAEE
ncbi:MAG: cold shock domain-containing protein [Nanoarchaeota archaeon]|nr:cold shock domain-containing protein [Nanoarchaeota archaeon]MBU1005501.1 cold shock domain-containing protein [Nanoarchaeota archaeon]MBU1945715.1 cold shock domain-containing protein [Nanoarchaeota archaeon]